MSRAANCYVIQVTSTGWRGPEYLYQSVEHKAGRMTMCFHMYGAMHYTYELACAIAHDLYSEMPEGEYNVLKDPDW